MSVLNNTHHYNILSSVVHVDTGHRKGQNSMLPLTGSVVTLEVKGQHFPVAADIRHFYPHSFIAGPVYDASDVGHSFYSTHKDEDTPTSITTTDVTIHWME